MEERDSHRQIESPRSGASRIQEKDAAAFRACRLVRMPAYHNLKSGGCRVKIERLNIVKNVNRSGMRLYDFGFGKSERPRLGIHVSPNGKNRARFFKVSRISGSPTSPA